MAAIIAQSVKQTLCQHEKPAFSGKSRKIRAKGAPASGPFLPTPTAIRVQDKTRSLAERGLQAASMSKPGTAPVDSNPSDV
jgi:hypothetical protein